MTDPRSSLLRDLGATGVLAVLALAEAAQVWLGLTLQHAEVTWAEALRLTAPSWIVLLGLTLPLLRILDALGPRGLTPVRLAAYAGGAATFAALHLAGSALLWQALGVAPSAFAANFTRLATLYFIPDVLTFVAVVTVHALVRRWREDRRRELEAASRRADDAHARFQALRGQLRPDFFFNTLNAVTALLGRGDARRSLDALSSLGALLRVSLTVEPGRPVPVEDEMDLVAAYLSIQRLRFPDRVRGSCALHPSASGCAVPALLLVQLVEALGDSGIEAGRPFSVDVEARVRRHRLEVELGYDGGRDGGGIAEDALERLRGRVARFDPSGRLWANPAGITIDLPARPVNGPGPRELEVAS
ncbi:MAG: hypothetical protein AMXMBFR53_44890 [Gemmatimonadota bacterium]